ncbi:MAG: NUDIX domain-containing protein, partial [Candidatus Aminicenantes bacterium]|nr:NUDIX domain-containing protein [Candidatus Aminicenantes bacterium]
MSSRDSFSAPQVGVGAVVIKDEKILLVKRKNPPQKGQWAIPGGKVEFGETMQKAAEREILEETGLIIHAK